MRKNNIILKILEIQFVIKITLRDVFYTSTVLTRKSTIEMAPVCTTSNPLKERQTNNFRYHFLEIFKIRL